MVTTAMKPDTKHFFNYYLKAVEAEVTSTPTPTTTTHFPDIDKETINEFLRKKHFDKDFMSVHEPSSALKQQLTERLEHGRNLIPKYVKLKLRLDKKTKNRVQNYLWSMTKCPVRYTWKYLGTKFWPRWIREGQCPKKSCSIPPGMSCRPAETVNKTILMWRCENLHCAWKHFTFPILTKCTCSCKSSKLSLS
ncbi:noggin-like [Biomphalaria glabrata]|uniref:Noggin-like n=1 Tax=Biomphalaria glabrata TaxID=6526 RepID=A0A2C9LNH7_BIOGL|nr:noggin-like [Biomphalaria glabrata]